MFDSVDADHLARLRANLNHLNLTDPDFGNSLGALMRFLVDEELSKRAMNAPPTTPEPKVNSGEDDHQKKPKR